MGTTGDIAMTGVTTVVVTDTVITGNAAELPTPKLINSRKKPQPLLEPLARWRSAGTDSREEEKAEPVTIRDRFGLR
jgi:hypothetical protein